MNEEKPNVNLREQGAYQTAPQKEWLSKYEKPKEPVDPDYLRFLKMNKE